MSKSKYFLAEHKVCKHRKFRTIFLLTVIFVKENLTGTFSFLGSPFVKASL
jgi:hypothetical protein